MRFRAVEGGLGRLFWNNVRVAARTAGRWNNWHLVTVRWRRRVHFRVDVRRADHAVGLAELLAERLVGALLRRTALRIGC